jgi:hypothetical protein
MIVEFRSVAPVACNRPCRLTAFLTKETGSRERARGYQCGYLGAKNKTVTPIGAEGFRFRIRLCSRDFKHDLAMPRRLDPDKYYGYCSFGSGWQVPPILSGSLAQRKLVFSDATARRT